ncbi:MAG: glutamine-synthetase adenylyltransferase, partial [Parasphingopyxis sp.]
MSGNRPVNDICDAIARARDHSPFLRKQIEAHGDIVERLEAGDFAAAEGLARMAENGLEIGAALRRRRQRHALVAAIGDLAGEWDLSATVARLSEFADRTVETALAAAWDDRHPGEDPRGIAAIALGKLGSRELNYSSDIDIMLIFDPAAIPADDRDAAQKSALKIAQQLLRLLQDRTPEGYVFRVDLRLRPAPEVTPIVLPVDAAISHYETSAEPWERAAFIRARHLAGDADVSHRFLTAIEPFVWRRSVDFGAIREVRGITRRIRDHYA